MRLVQHRGRLGEEVGETDSDDLAVLSRRLLDLGKKDGKDLGE
jgi:hypothetical protein